jgi:hypothetical protein
VADEEAEEHGPYRIDNEKRIEQQMKESVDQARQIETQYAPDDCADIFYDVKDAADELLDSIYRPTDDATHNIGNTSDNGAAIDVQPTDDIVDAVAHGVGARVHDVLSRVGHRFDDRFNGIGDHGYAARHGVAEVF